MALSMQQQEQRGNGGVYIYKRTHTQTNSIIRIPIQVLAVTSEWKATTTNN